MNANVSSSIGMFRSNSPRHQRKSVSIDVVNALKSSYLCNANNLMLFQANRRINISIDDRQLPQVGVPITQQHYR